MPPFEAANQLSLAVKINAGKFARIPSRYSEDLHRAIRWMLSLDSTERPSVEDLERIPKVATMARENVLLIREYNLNQMYATKSRELRAKEVELERREAAVKEKEERLAALEQRLAVAASGSALGNRGAAAAGPGPFMDVDHR